MANKKLFKIRFIKIINGDNMDLLTILRVILGIFLVIILALLIVNRNAENQNKIRLAFVLFVVLYVVQFLMI